MKVDENGKGCLEATSLCKVPNMLCKAWYNEESIANIISLADIADDYRVTMDTSKDKAIFSVSLIELCDLGKWRTDYAV